jgi:hypothetical protein
LVIGQLFSDSENAWPPARPLDGGRLGIFDTRSGLLLLLAAACAL